MKVLGAQLILACGLENGKQRACWNRNCLCAVTSKLVTVVVLDM